MTAVGVADPLRATLRRVGDGDEWLRASIDFDGATETIPIATLAATPERLAHLIARQCRRWETSDRAVGASFLFGHVVWRVVAPALACYLAERRVPVLAPHTVALSFDDDGDAIAVALRTTALLALPGDTAAAHPDVTVVADRPALRSALRAGIATTIAPLIPSLKPWARRSDRTQWGEVADCIAAAAHLAGTRLDRDEAIVEAQALLEGTPPIHAACNFVEFAHAGRTERIHLRNTCCLAYRLPDHEYCSTCPLEEPARRVDRWRTAMEQEQTT